MPRVFDNIDQHLLPILRDTLAVSERADFCVGYFNLRGWRTIDDLIAQWQPDAGQICRVLIGMQRPPHEDVRALYQAVGDEVLIDNARASEIKHKFAAHLREQITFGIPTAADEKGLQRLARQLREGKVQVKLFLPYPLHAKLYLLFRKDINNPITGFVGSSNLTFSGLSKQGELNVDVLDHDAANKLSTWFDARWSDRWCLDISSELAEVIEQSWAREALVPPYHIYLNMAYHLSVEARAGLSQFRLPTRFDEELFDFQKAAVKIAARHLHRRGGVIIGDVVGLGKTMMATALARMVEDDLNYETLIICPKNLVPMWEHYRKEYGLRGTVKSLTEVVHKTRGLKDLKPLRKLSLQTAGALDDQDDEVDLASYAWQIWKTATENNPALAREIEALPPVIYTAKRSNSPLPMPSPQSSPASGRGGEREKQSLIPTGEGLGVRASANVDSALVYVKSPEGNDHLAWVNEQGNAITESQFTILRAAECAPEEPALERAENHHELVAIGLNLAVTQDKAVGGGLGRPSSPRRKCYDRLKEYARSLHSTLFADDELERAIEDIYARPLLESAADTLNRLMRSGVNDEQLSEAVKYLREENQLTYAEDDAAQHEPKIVCSMGLRAE